MRELRLSHQPPRDYPAIEAYRGRVWRNTPALYGREVTLLSFACVLYGVLLDHLLMWMCGALCLVLSVLFTGLTTLVINAKRAQLVREGAAVMGVITGQIRQRWWHEIARAPQHRSFKLTYRYQLTEGDREISYEGSITLCRCALDRLKSEDEIVVTYDVKRPQRSLPLRLAVMKIPH